MLFRRREDESFWQRTRVHLWPRRSWARSTRYVTHRLTRLSASPHVIALGFAIGAFAATTPFLGCHVILGAILSWLLGGSIIASFFGTFVGNPLTYPIAWYASFKIGAVFLGSPPMPDHLEFNSQIFRSSWEQLWPILKPTIIGCVPVGLLVATVSYFLMRGAVMAYQERRRRRFQLRQTDNQEAVPVR